MSYLSKNRVSCVRIEASGVFLSQSIPTEKGMSICKSVIVDFYVTTVLRIDVADISHFITL